MSIDAGEAIAIRESLESIAESLKKILEILEKFSRMYL